MPPGLRAPGAPLLAAAVAALTACAPPPPASPELVATERQFGPVGYRDPLGVIDPTGRWLATAAQEVVRLRALDGADTVTLASGTTRVLHLAWDRNGALVAEQRGAGANWWRYDPVTRRRDPLWRDGLRLGPDSGRTVAADGLRELAWSRDGRVAGVERSAEGSTVWAVDSAGRGAVVGRSPNPLSFPAWLPDGRVVCLMNADDRQRVSLPCGGPPPPGLETLEAYGPIGVAPDGKALYVAIPAPDGFVGLHRWRLDAPGDTMNARPLARFERDTYAPSVADDGTVLFKAQEYHTEVLVMPSGGGDAVLRTAFQAETPSWNWAGDSIGITYGTWRRLTDDYRYPDIAQDAGIVAATGPSPAAAPATVVQASVSEDQGLTWSPNGRWIAFHSHQQASDDVWLRPADSTGPPVRISNLGRGSEVGWPRWSEDGRWIVFDGDASRGGRARSNLWVIGVDQERGRVRVPARQVPLAGFDDDVLHAEWLGSSDDIVFSAFRPPRGHAIYRVPRRGGDPQPIHEYRSPQRTDGFGVSRDGTWLVYPEPDSAGTLQLYRILASGGSRPEQLTFDPTDKTQPAVSPDGRTIAFTRWRYQARFYRLRPDSR